MFDLPKNLNISQRQKRTLLRVRRIMLLGFIALILSVGYSLLFPSKEFEFDFSSPDANKNTIADPRNEQSIPIRDGKVSENEILTFDTGTTPGYSVAQVEIELTQEATIQANVSARRGHRAFFASQGTPAQPNNGALLRYEDTYYIMSEGKLRSIPDIETAKKFSWREGQFHSLTETEYSLQEKGEDITFQYETYPDGTLFFVRGTYYQLIANELHPFISEQAFQTHYPKTWTLEKNDTLFDIYKPLRSHIGFRNGTLISFGGSVYALSDGNAHPIINVPTFETLGYSWDDVIEASSEEFDLYTKTKLFTLAQPHPNGTTYITTEEDRLFRVEGNLIREIFGTASHISDIHSTHITIETSSRENESSCEMKQGSFFLKNTLVCTISFDSIANPERSDYQFKFKPNESVEITNIEVTLKKQFSLTNLLSTLGTIKERILLRFSQ